MSNASTVSAVLLTTLLAACATPPPAGSAACVPRPVAQLPVEFHAGVPVVPVRIDGQPVSMMLDLGASTTVVAETTADRLNLARDPSALSTITGVGGTMTRWAAIARPLQLGELTLNNKRMEVAPMAVGSADHRIDGSLGLDVLTKYDVDWDLPDHHVTFNAKSGCIGPPVAWPSPAVEVSAAPENSFGRPKFMLLPLLVDNRPVTAMLDTGTAVSVISPAAAAALETRDQARDVSVRLGGWGPDSMSGTAHRFRSLTFAGETLPGWVMVVSPVPLWAGSMILGVEFMRTHRAWLPADGSVIWFGPPVAQQTAAATPG